MRQGEIFAHFINLMFNGHLDCFSFLLTLIVLRTNKRLDWWLGFWTFSTNGDMAIPQDHFYKPNTNQKTLRHLGKVIFGHFAVSVQ